MKTNEGLEEMLEKDPRKYEEQANQLADALIEYCKNKFPYNTTYYAIILALLKLHSLSDYPLQDTLNLLKEHGEEQLEMFKRQKINEEDKDE